MKSRKDWGTISNWKRLRNMTDSVPDPVATKDFIGTLSKTQMGSESQMVVMCHWWSPGSDGYILVKYKTILVCRKYTLKYSELKKEREILGEAEAGRKWRLLVQSTVSITLPSLSALWYLSLFSSWKSLLPWLPWCLVLFWFFLFLFIF